MKRLSIAVSLAILMWACDAGSRSSTPTSPSPPAARPIYTLSGVVSAETPTGLAPVEGVFVQENLRQRAITDANGFYTISGLSTLNNTIQARKASYDLFTRILAINGDTQLVRH